MDPIRQDIDIGLAENDGTGDTLRAGFNKVNLNFRAIWDTVVVPFAEKIGLIERVQGAFIPVQTYALRDQIPVSYRRYGFRVTVVEAFTDSAGKVQPLDFVWTQNRFPDAPEGQRDGWLSLRTEADLLNRGNHTGGQAQDTIFGLPQALAGLTNVDANVIRAISTNAALQISSPSIQAAAATGPFTASWWIDGVAPVTQRLEWNGWSINLDGRARRFVLQTDWTVVRQMTFIGNSMTDANDIDAGGNWSGIYAGRVGVAFTNVAKYSQDANKQALRSGAKKIRLWVDGDSLPAGGGTKNIRLINFLAPGTDNPDSFLNTSAGDGVTVNNSITGTAAGRHMTISIPTGGSALYKITVDAGQTAVGFPPGTIFVPDAAATMSVNEVHIDAGRINFFPLQPYLDLVASMVGMGRGNPMTVWPILPADNDSATDRQRLVAANTAKAAAYPLLTPRVTVGGVTYDPLSYFQFRGGTTIDPLGNVPTQYHKGGDTLHFNTAGNNVRADFAELWRAQRARPPLLTFDTPVSWYAEATDGLGNPMQAYVLARPMLAPFGSTTNILRPDGNVLELSLAQADADAVNTKEMLSKLRRLSPETGSSLRVRLANRIYATLDNQIGFYFRKLRITANTTVDDMPTVKIIDRLLSSPVSQFFRRPSGETAGPESTFRIRIGNRLFVSLNAVQGLFPRKLTIPMTTKFENGVALLGRLIGLNVADKLLALTPEMGGTGIRWRIGNRLLATLDLARGFYPRRATLPAATRIDDDLSASLVSRLLGAGIATMLKRLPVEAGGVIRVRWNNRLLMQWSASTGFVFSRMILPRDVKMADQPGVLLTDRLGGSTLPYAENANYSALSVNDSVTGKKVLRSYRKSDGRQFNALTSSSANAIAQSLTADNKIIYWDELGSRHLWISAEGGISYRVFGDVLIIDCWGDSLTAGAGSFGTGVGQGPYPKQLRDLIALSGLTVVINNRGVGGLGSPGISALQGGAPTLVTVENNQIPASGPVNITGWTVIPGNSQGPAGGVLGTIAGVPGRLVMTFDATTFALTSRVFTRTTAGVAVAVPANTAFIPDFGVQTQERVNLIKTGRNDGVNGLSVILAAVAAMRGYIKSIFRRSLVLAVEVGSHELGTPTQTSFLNINTNLATLYGDDFVDVNAAPTTEEMTKLGFVPDTYGVYGNHRTDAADLNGRASGGWRFTGNPASGDTVSLGGTAITFGTDVAIGSTSVDTAANLAAYLNTNSAAFEVTAVSGTSVSGGVLCTVVSTVNGAAANSKTIGRSSSVIVPANATTISSGAAATTLANGGTVPGVPSGMMSGAVNVGNDFLHRNNFGYALNALRVYRKIYVKGWIASLLPI